MSCSDAAAKWALPETGAAMAMVWRGLLGGLTVTLLARGRGLWPRRLGLLTLRSLTQCVVTVIFYLCWLRGVGLADSYAVNAAAPLLMTLLAIPMLGERVGWRRWTSTAVGFLGVLLILRPGGDLWRWETLPLLGAVALLAVTRIWLRTLSRTETATAVAFALMVAMTLSGLALLPFMPPARWVPSGGVVLALLAFGACTGIAQVLFSRAFGLAPVSALAPYEYSPLLWGTALGALLWGEWPSLATLAGAAVVIGAGLYNLHRERLRRRAALPAAQQGDPA
ncbi:DMT family transporter [Roseomonas sp. NAR14]|uniref:DMT family transporter n=1 Tax=Roseomonas acroporae TaxID=2937791 RepID=A0A9X2BWC4_9PROT|nr:DMT family transporter [Roseomonas acroporae]